jgi:transcriptional regulator with PAS, ATPase and Fis domain
VVAASDSTVLIRGETGTGKELLARAIHDLSGRSHGPFVAVSCGALPDTLLESELFGYRAGAFTGADRDKPGRFARAEGGTLLLDEIGEVSPALQIRLLRVLQERTYEPLGGNRSIQANVRVVAATNRNLDILVRKGSFRRDLFYRVNVLPVELPPLRRRREDIPLLVDHFVARFNRLQGKSITGVSAEVLQLLMAHDWPGNVRELENVIEHAVVLCPEGLAEPGHLPESLAPLASRSRTESAVVSTVRAVEAHAIRDALRRHHNSRLAAARDLGIHRATLYRKMRELGITPPATDGRSRKRGPSGDRATG